MRLQNNFCNFDFFFQKIFLFIWKSLLVTEIGVWKNFWKKKIKIAKVILRSNMIIIVSNTFRPVLVTTVFNSHAVGRSLLVKAAVKSSLWKSYFLITYIFFFFIINFIFISISELKNSETNVKWSLNQIFIRFIYII